MAKANLLRHNLDRKDKFDWEVPELDGLDNTSDPASIGDSETPNTLNTVYDLSRASQTRKGLVKLLTTSIPNCTGIAGMHPFYLSDGVSRYLVFAAQVSGQTYLYKYDNAGGSTVISSAFTTGTQWDFTTYKNSVYAVNGFDGIWAWNGSGSFTLVNALPLACITTHKNRLWGTLYHTSRLVFCDANDPATWPTNNYLEINTDDGQIGVGVKEYLDSIIIFKTDSVWYVLGEPLGAGTQTVLGNLQLRQVDSDVGCVSFRTIKKTRRGILMWASTSGIVVMQNYHAQIISENVEQTFLTAMNPNYMQTMWAVYSPNEKKYILGYPSVTSQIPDSAIMVDLSDPSRMRLSLWDDYYGSCGCLYRFTNKDTVLIGRPDKGFITEAFQGYNDIAGDNGQATSGTAPITTTVTNYMDRPSFEDNTSTGWVGAGSGSPAIGSSSPFSGTKYFNLTGISGLTESYSVSGLPPTAAVTVSFYYRGAATTPSVILSHNTTGYGTQVLTGSSSWQRFTQTITLQNAVAPIIIELLIPDGQSIDFDAFQVEIGSSATSYFDGNTPTSGATTYSWTGATNISTSLRSTSSTVTNDSTHLIDTTKAWTPGALVDAGVTIISGTGTGQKSFITANSSTSLTVAPAWTTTPNNTSVYSIGAYDAYRDTPIIDVHKTAYDKKWKNFNVFSDSEQNYPLNFGYALDYAPVAYDPNAGLSLGSGALQWTGVGGANKWGQVGAKWGKRLQLFLQFAIGDVGKHFQARLGNNKANQPWRVSKYSITIKFKKVRPDQQ